MKKKNNIKKKNSSIKTVLEGSIKQVPFPFWKLALQVNYCKNRPKNDFMHS